MLGVKASNSVGSFGSMATGGAEPTFESSLKLKKIATGSSSSASSKDDSFKKKSSPTNAFRNEEYAAMTLALSNPEEAERMERERRERKEREKREREERKALNGGGNASGRSWFTLGKKKNSNNAFTNNKLGEDDLSVLIPVSPSDSLLVSSPTPSISQPSLVKSEPYQTSFQNNSHSSQSHANPQLDKTPVVNANNSNKKPYLPLNMRDLSLSGFAVSSRTDLEEDLLEGGEEFEWGKKLAEELSGVKIRSISDR
jgi:hypothetical protein